MRTRRGGGKEAEARGGSGVGDGVCTLLVLLVSQVGWGKALCGLKLGETVGFGDFEGSRDLLRAQACNSLALSF